MTNAQDPNYMAWNTSRAKLPESYLAARAALQLAAKHFSPASYMAAQIALKQCGETDEMADWPATVETMASYARIADDSSLERLARKVEKARAAWKASLPEVKRT